jgi:hypothetical protein
MRTMARLLARIDQLRAEGLSHERALECIKQVEETKLAAKARRDERALQRSAQMLRELFKGRGR